ncbi:hypothetical protein K440DRAFT_529275, partial [Wilcoxina mikolae CBS 423.85]
GSRYGHLTSNIVEAANALFLDERELSVLSMLHGIWEKEQDRRARREEKALLIPASQLLTPYGVARLAESIHFAQLNTVRMESIPGGVGTVTQSRDGKRYEVNLRTQTCSCKRFQDTKIPCGHAITVMHRIRETPNDYLPDFIKKGVWAAAYQD